MRKVRQGGHAEGFPGLPGEAPSHVFCSDLLAVHARRSAVRPHLKVWALGGRKAGERAVVTTPTACLRKG